MKLVYSMSFHQPETPDFCITLKEDKSNKITPWVTHWHDLQDGGYYSGHYFSDKTLAKKDFVVRITEAMSDTLNCGGGFGVSIPKESALAEKLSDLTQELAAVREQVRAQRSAIFAAFEELRLHL